MNRDHLTHLILGRYAEMPPEERLLTAVLVRAIEDFTRLDGGVSGRPERPDRIYENARDWFLHQGDDPWSYRWTLAVLGIAHESVRMVVQKVREDPKGMKYWTLGPRMKAAGGGGPQKKKKIIERSETPCGGEVREEPAKMILKIPTVQGRYSEDPPK